MELNWRSQRQIIIFSIYFLIIFIPVLFVSLSLLHKTPSCYDGTQNGDETGIDCNGSCELKCEGTYRDVRINFTRGMKVTEGVYDIFALVENFNTNVRFPSVPYEIDFYSANGKLLGSASGTLSLLPQTKSAIYIPSVSLAQEPKTIDLTLLPHKALAVYNTDNIPKNITVQNWQTQRGANNSLQIVGELQNPNNREVRNLSVYALVYDDTKTVYAVSRTRVLSLKGRENTAVAFSWGDIVTPTNVDFVVVFDE
jgi:hypothetical protein